jgi:hypothetical protein
MCELIALSGNLSALSWARRGDQTVSSVTDASPTNYRDIPKKLRLEPFPWDGQTFDFAAREVI